jgi:hypothetical protein
MYIFYLGCLSIFCSFRTFCGKATLETVFGIESASMRLFGIQEHEDIMWDAFQCSGNPETTFDKQKMRIQGTNLFNFTKYTWYLAFL